MQSIARALVCLLAAIAVLTLDCRLMIGDCRLAGAARALHVSVAHPGIAASDLQARAGRTSSSSIHHSSFINQHFSTAPSSIHHSSLINQHFSSAPSSIHQSSFITLHSAFADDPGISSADPYVLLDAAKRSLADSKLERAGRLLKAIPLGRSQDYVDEEVVLQRLLLEGAFLSSTTFLLEALGRAKLGDGKYAHWLAEQRMQHAQAYSTLGNDYLARTANGPALSFVRFRLPAVNEEHLKDVEFYSDPQVLLAAAKNWEEGREGLGKGLVLSQARVAVVLAAALHYDLPQASATIMGVGRRLAAGVPLRLSTELDWIADTAQRDARPGDSLAALALAADSRLLNLPAGQLSAGLKQRALERRSPPKPAPAAAPAEDTKKKSGKGKSNKRRRKASK